MDPAPYTAWTMEWRKTKRKLNVDDTLVTQVCGDCVIEKDSGESRINCRRGRQSTHTHMAKALFGYEFCDHTVL
jgi:hypothetical protein